MKKETTFEDFLAEKHTKQAEGILDDDMPNDFDNWLVELEQDSIIKYANEYAKSQKRIKLRCYLCKRYFIVKARLTDYHFNSLGNAMCHRCIDESLE